MKSMRMASWRVVAATALTLACAVRVWAAGPADFSVVVPKMQEFVDKGEISGIVTLVANKDGVVYKNAVGTTDGARKMETDDLFWIASMSKPMTSVAAGILVDDGKLKWDDPVSKYIPEFAGLKVGTEGTALERPIQVRDLLTHTSGLAEYTHTEQHWTLEQFSKQIASQPLKYQPGAKWQYSTAGIDAVGRVVEVASGMPLDQFMSKRIFEPVGMKDTSFWLSAENEKRYAHTYVMRGGKLEEAKIPYFYGTVPTDRQRPPLGGAGLISTADDVCKFYQMTMNDGMAGEKRVLKSETLKEMLTPQTGKLRPGMPWGYGIAIMSNPKAMEANAMLSANSYGHGGAFGTNSWVDPKRGLVFVLMLERDRLMPSPDNSPMHITFQDVAVKAADGAK